MNAPGRSFGECTTRIAWRPMDNLREIRRFEHEGTRHPNSRSQKGYNALSRLAHVNANQAPSSRRGGPIRPNYAPLSFED